MTPDMLGSTITAVSKLLEFMKASDASDGRGNSTNQYLDWYVGLTDDPDRRRDEHGQPRLWNTVVVPSFQIAEMVKRVLYGGFTLKSGVHGGGAGSVHVYVFKLTNATRPTLREAAGN